MEKHLSDGDREYEVRQGYISLAEHMRNRLRSAPQRGFSLEDSNSSNHTPDITKIGSKQEFEQITYKKKF